MDDLDVAGIEASLAADLDSLSDLPAEPSLSAEDREAGWSIKRKDAEPAREPTVEETVSKAFAETAEAGADAEADRQWQREQRRLADEALRRAGVDPEQRHEAKMSRREVTRRLYQAEQVLREDPARGITQIMEWYGRSGDDAQRAAVAHAALASLGYSAPNDVTAQERQRLQHYEQAARQHERAVAGEMQRMRPVVDAFAAARPDFEELRGTMYALMQAGVARDLESAYEAARRARGLPTSEAQAAQAADAARRSKLASAKAAGTPRMSSAPLRELPPDHSGKSTTDLLNEAYDQMVR